MGETESVAEGEKEEQDDESGNTFQGEAAYGHDPEHGKRSAYPKNLKKPLWLEPSKQEEMERDETESAIPE